MDKILLVNDCKFESIVMRDLLDSLGYNVEITNEYDALNRIKYLYPEIIIVNLIMKETTGDKLIKKIKSFNSEIRCFLCSSNPIALTDFQFISIDGIIQTPTNKEKIQEVIRLNSSNSLVKETEKTSKFVFCPYCGNKFNGDRKFKFCSFCGDKL